MKKILDTLRRKADDVLSGRMGPHAQKLAWTAASVHPGLRAARQAQLGHIHLPLAMLERGTFGLPYAARLRARLVDMAGFSNQCRGAATCATASDAHTFVRTPFNGKVLYALHSCGAFDPSGYASRSVALIAALKARGIAPIITTRPGYPWDLAHHRDTPKCTDVDHHGLRFRLTPDASTTIHAPESQYIEAYARHLQTLALANRASVIHAASNYLNGAAAAAAGRSLGIVSIYEMRGLWHLTRAFSEPGYTETDHYRYCESRELAACELVDHVVVLSGGLRQWLTERGIPEGKISIVGNAAHAPTSPFQEGEPAALAVRKRHAIPATAKVLGYLGAIVEYEGLDALVHAHARTPEEHRPVLLFVGSGKHEAALRQLVSKLGTTRQVVFAGRVSPDQVSAHYTAMDALVLPRRDDILTRLVPAIKPFEVLAHRRPLFVSPPLARALGDTLPDGYQVLDIESVDRLDRILDGCSHGQSHVEVPTWNDRAEQVLALYERLTTANPEN